MDDRFDWADYPPQHVGPLAPPGAELVENPSNVDIDECAEIEDIEKCDDVDECADGDSESDDEFLDDGTDILIINII